METSHSNRNKLFFCVEKRYFCVEKSRPNNFYLGIGCVFCHVITQVIIVVVGGGGGIFVVLYSVSRQLNMRNDLKMTQSRRKSTL